MLCTYALHCLNVSFPYHWGYGLAARITPGAFPVWSPRMKFSIPRKPCVEYLLAVAVLVILCTGTAMAAPQAGPYTISGTVYDDLNGNHIQDPGEPGLVNWTIDVLDYSGPSVSVVGSALTDANGFYQVDTHGPGTYTVSEQLRSGWVATAPADGCCNATLTGGTDPGSYNFGNLNAVFPLSVIHGTVFDDLNGNGIRDPSEPGLSGWTIAVANIGGAPFLWQLTDTEGSYAVNNAHAAGTMILPDGTYTVSEELMPGWLGTAPVGGSWTVTVSAANPDTRSYDFGDMQGGPVPVPEFPSAVLPAAAIAGLLAAVFIIRKNRES